MDPSLMYATASLIAVMQSLLQPSTFLLNKFFPNITEFDTEEVAVDVEIGKRRMAPFVSPLMQGKLVEGRRVQTNLFKPAYIKDKRRLDPKRPVKRAIGERLGGGVLTPAERAAANLAFELEDQTDILTRRLEWMAAQAMQTGTVLVTGEGYPDTLVDFGRDSRLTVANTGSNKWGVQANFDANGLDPLPVPQINAYCVTVLKLSGSTVTDIVFTNSAWNAFLNAADVNGAKVAPVLNPNGNVVNPAPAPIQGATWQGRWGTKDLWLYNEWFVDENDVEQPMLTDGNILLGSADIQGNRAFGVIIDDEIGYPAMAFAPKTWTEHDPGVRLLMMQSAPLMIPSRPNASLCAKVL